MDDQACPRCKTTKYRNPSLKLLVNTCGHTLCENCVELLFVRGSGACPVCNTALRRNNFRLQLFENPEVEKEVDIRKKVLRDYNKKEEDFASLREYNDYLEEIESIVFSLTNGTDIEETKRRIEQYRNENKDIIKKNRSKLSRDEEYLEDLIEEERQTVELARQAVLKEQLLEKHHKQKNKEALIDDLMFSDMSADDILAARREEMAQTFKPIMTGVSAAKAGQTLPIQNEEGELYTYECVVMDLCGPDTPPSATLRGDGYMANIRDSTAAEKGGGYSTAIACERALMDGFCGLYFSAVDLMLNQPGPDSACSSGRSTPMEVT